MYTRNSTRNGGRKREKMTQNGAEGVGNSKQYTACRAKPAPFPRDVVSRVESSTGTERLWLARLRPSRPWHRGPGPRAPGRAGPGPPAVAGPRPADSRPAPSRIPHAGGAVVAGRQDPAAVRAEAGISNRRVVPQWSRHGLPADRGPHLRRAIRAGRDQRTTVGAEGGEPATLPGPPCRIANVMRGIGESLRRIRSAQPPTHSSRQNARRAIGPCERHSLTLAMAGTGLAYGTVSRQGEPRRAGYNQAS